MIDIKWFDKIGKVLKFLYIWMYILIFMVKNRKSIKGMIILPSTMTPMIIVAKLLKIRVAIFLDGLSKFNLINVFTRFIISFVDIIVVESLKLVKIWNLPKFTYSKVMIGSLYVDEELFRRVKGFENRIYDIGFLGRLTIEKGVLELIKSIIFLENLGLKFKVVIIGTGRLEEVIKKIINKYELKDFITFMGEVKHDFIPEILNDIKVLVLPSLNEGVPNALLEAMSCGSVVLATDVGGVRDIVIDRLTGFILSCPKHQCITEKVLEVFSNPSLLKNISLNGERWIKKFFSFEASKKRYNIIMRELLKK